jgi:FAD/FMN-containing dehydrogenase
VKTRTNVRKASTGYELTQLFIGAEGTLGIIIELVLKIRKIQRCQTQTSPYLYFQHAMCGLGILSERIRSG